MTDPRRGYSYEGPLSFREGLNFEGCDSLYLGDAEKWFEHDELTTAIARAFGLTDGDVANVRITVEETE